MVSKKPWLSIESKSYPGPAARSLGDAHKLHELRDHLQGASARQGLAGDAGAIAEGRAQHS